MPGTATDALCSGGTLFDGHMTKTAVNSDSGIPQALYQPRIELYIHLNSVVPLYLASAMMPTTLVITVNTEQQSTAI